MLGAREDNPAHVKQTQPGSRREGAAQTVGSLAEVLTPSNE